MRRTRTQQGFTLIELTVVITIISVLAAIAVPNFIKFISKTRQTEAKTMLPLLACAEMDHKLRTGKFTDAALNPVAPGQSWKADAPGWKELGFTPRGISRYSYEIKTSGDGFVVRAVGNIDDDAQEDVWELDGKTLKLSNTQNDME